MKSPSVISPDRIDLAADDDHDHADDADDDGGAGRGGRDAGDRPADVVEQPVDTDREDLLLAIFRDVGLDHAHAAERLRKAAGHLRLDLAALPEDRPQALEGIGHPAAEEHEHDERDGGQAPVEPEQHPEREAALDEPAGQLHEAGADEVPDAFGVVHDARDELARLRRVEVAHRKAHHVVVDVLAHLGDGALGRHAEDLRERERRHRLHDRGARRREGQHGQEVGLAFADHVVHEELRRRGGQHEADGPVDEHQAETEREPCAMGPDQAARFFPGRRELDSGFGSHGSTVSESGARDSGTRGSGVGARDRNSGVGIIGIRDSSLACRLSTRFSPT